MVEIRAAGEVCHAEKEIGKYRTMKIFEENENYWG